MGLRFNYPKLQATFSLGESDHGGSLAQGSFDVFRSDY